MQIKCWFDSTTRPLVALVDKFLFLARDHVLCLLCASVSSFEDEKQNKTKQKPSPLWNLNIQETHRLCVHLLLSRRVLLASVRAREKIEMNGPLAVNDINGLALVSSSCPSPSPPKKRKIVKLVSLCLSKCFHCPTNHWIIHSFFHRIFLKKTDKLLTQALRVDYVVG